MAFLVACPAFAAVGIELTLSPAIVHAGQSFTCNAHVTDGGMPAVGSIRFGISGGGWDWSGATIPIDASGNATMTVLSVPGPASLSIHAVYLGSSAAPTQWLTFDVLLAELPPAIPVASVPALTLFAGSLSLLAVIRLRTV
jgi:hypothetical protein